MIFSIATTLLIKALSISRDLTINLAANKIWQKFDQDLETVIFKLIQTQQRQFKDQFPEATLDLKPAEIKPVFERYFGNLTAADLDAPLTPELLAPVFAHLWLQPRFREKGGFETIDPRFRNALLACARNFMDQFKRNATAAFERNSAAATAILLNSLAQAGKNDAQILQLLQQIHAQPEDLPILLENVIASQLLPAIKTEIQHEFNRFREDWQFILKVLRFETSRDEEAEREWLEQLAQVMEWKGFHIVSRAPDPDIPGELFEIEDKDRFGNVEKLICWGCPLDACPDKSKIKLAITTMKEHCAQSYFVVSQARLDHATIQYLNQHAITTHKTLPEFVQTILDIARHRQTVISDYEKKAIYRHYIDLFAHTQNDPNTPLDLPAFFHHWLQQDGSNHISLLGDFGTGKTEFCRRMQWQLLKNYQPTKTRIPVVITLRDQKGLRLGCNIHIKIAQ